MTIDRILTPDQSPDVCTSAASTGPSSTVAAPLTLPPDHTMSMSMDEDVHVARLDVVPSPVALPTPTPVTATAIASTLLVEGSGAQRSIHPIHRSLQVASAHPRGNSAANSRAGTPVQPPPDGVLSEDVLRKCILAIQRDATLNAREKAQRTQSLMSSPYKGSRLGRSYSARQSTESLDMYDKDLNRSAPGLDSLNTTNGSEQPNLSARRCDTGCNDDTGKSSTCPPTPSLFDLQPSYHNEAQGILGCKHYQRGCKLFAECSQEWVCCRLCHNETADHEMDRHATKWMLCMYCKEVQPVGQSCRACHKTLGHYYCGTCKLWNDDPTADIYHCDDCGVCRVGKGLGIDYFHCDTCNTCMSIEMRDNHRCIERNLESDCPICGDYMQTSQDKVIFMNPCGHAIHLKCYNQYVQTSYQCPICWKSLGDMTGYFRRLDAMLAEHVMPKEYAALRSVVLCNDCEERSETAYHFLYHKCQCCGSYNTKVITTVQADATTDTMDGEEEDEDDVMEDVADDANDMVLDAGPNN